MERRGGAHRPLIMANYPNFGDFPGDNSYWQEPDFLLSNLVSLLANKLESQLGITLLVKGTIMSGILVGELEYLTAVNNIFKSIAKESLVNPTKEDLQMVDESFIFDMLTEDKYEYNEDEDGDEDAEDAEDDDNFDDEDDFDVMQIRHLHLKDPVIVYPQSALSLSESPLPIIRVKLTAVDGWMLGRMAMVSPDDFMPPDSGIRH
jgi:hypothetical protein